MFLLTEQYSLRSRLPRQPEMPLRVIPRVAMSNSDGSYGNPQTKHRFSPTWRSVGKKTVSIEREGSNGRL